MKLKEFRYFVGDFETTVFDGQETTEVWASAVVEMYSEDVKIFHSIEDTFNYLVSLNANVCIYYHNLKFDGAFWLSWLMYKSGFRQAYYGEDTDIKWQKDKYMYNNTFKYAISDMGQWYDITIKVRNHIIQMRDSLKLLPFSVKRIGESFQTKHKKLDMEYKGYRYAGCEITEEEQQYIANDVLVVKEALEIMFDEGHKSLTIGSCCLEEFKKSLIWDDYKTLFPDVYQIPLDSSVYDFPNVGEYIRKSYKGGWCYLVDGKENILKYNGTTADVNSLYPSMMSGESGNLYPVGKPKFWKGNFIPGEAYWPHRYYFVRIRTKFYLKHGMLPCIQIKGNMFYNPTKWLKTSDVWSKSKGRYYDKYYDLNGTLKDANVIMTLTMTDYELIKDHYDLVDCEILDGCYFDAMVGIFDNYIEKYKKIKMESKGAKRELAKLFLNNLYGKMASSPDSSFKVAYTKDDNSLGFLEVTEYDKKPGYIPVGAAITSYARNFTIRAAQQNYYGVDKPGFIYADTDSIHCDLPPEEIKGIRVHAKDFCCWKLEACWDVGLFVRQKTYVEHIVKEDLEECDPHYNIRCAGMPELCKQLFEWSMQGEFPEEEREYLTEEELEFLKTKRELTDFRIGLKVPGKLLPRHIQGGVVLVETTYEMR